MYVHYSLDLPPTAAARNLQPRSIFSRHLFVDIENNESYESRRVNSKTRISFNDGVVRPFIRVERPVSFKNPNFFRTMDLDILKAIVQSCEEVINNENPGECDKSFMEQKFPVTDRTMLATLTKSFTNLISYKVSQEAHQRYSVRLHVIVSSSI